MLDQTGIGDGNKRHWNNNRKYAIWSELFSSPWFVIHVYLLCQPLFWEENEGQNIHLPIRPSDGRSHPIGLCQFVRPANISGLPEYRCTSWENPCIIDQNRRYRAWNSAYSFVQNHFCNLTVHTQYMTSWSGTFTGPFHQLRVLSLNLKHSMYPW